MLTKNEAPLKRRPVWKIVLTCLGIFAGIVIVFLVWLGRLSERRWREMEVRVGEMKAEYKARIRPRPVLRGVAVPGNAWEDYLPAMAQLRFRNFPTLGTFINRQKDADRAAVEALLSEYGVFLDQLQKGAARAEGQFSYDWEAMAQRGAIVPFSTPLALLAICQTRFLREAGKSREAVDLLLDLAQFARDLGDNGPSTSKFTSMSLLSQCFDELREILAVKIVAVEDAAAIGRGLGILDGSFPRYSAALRCEALYFGTACLSDLQPYFSSFHGELPSLGPRILITHAFFEIDRTWSQAAEADGKSWQEALDSLRGLRADASKSWNPILNFMGTAKPQDLAYEADRDCRAQLRLLRAAASYRATGQISELEDPFGTKLLHTASGDKLRFWSVGPDGVDDGGARGGWNWSAPGGDVVLEIER